MMTKKTLPLVVEELRMLNEAVAEPKTPGILGWFTTDFWATAVTAATNIIAVAAIIGWIDRTNVEGLNAAVVALLGAAEVIAVNAALVWKYLSGRQNERIATIRARMQYFETVAIERMHLEKKNDA
jgi:hypothetical protein